MVDRELDKWAASLLHSRDGDDPEQREKALEHLLPIRDRILDNAQILRGEMLLDVHGRRSHRLRSSRPSRR